MITVFNATGRVGRQIVERLLAEGQQVRAIGRSASKLSSLAALGAQTRAINAEDVGALTSAFAQATAAFIVMPHDVRSTDYHGDQDRLGSALVQALREARVRHIVFLSSIGADREAGTGVVASLHRQEQRLRELSGANVLMLRAGAFYENFLEVLPLIREQGIVADALAPTTRVPMIATKDIARVAAAALITTDWEGVQIRELTGPRDLTYPQAVEIIASSIGRTELRYVHVPYEAMTDALEQAGFSRDVATQYVGLSRGLDDGSVALRLPAPQRCVGTTTFEAFARELAAAYSAL